MAIVPSLRNLDIDISLFLFIWNIQCAARPLGHNLVHTERKQFNTDPFCQVHCQYPRLFTINSCFPSSLPTCLPMSTSAPSIPFSPEAARVASMMDGFSCCRVHSDQHPMRLCRIYLLSLFLHKTHMPFSYSHHHDFLYFRSFTFASCPSLSLLIFQI